MGPPDLNECIEKVRPPVEGSILALAMWNFSLLVMSSVDIFVKHLEGLLPLEVLSTVSFVKIQFPSIAKL